MKKCKWKKCNLSREAHRASRRRRSQRCRRAAPVAARIRADGSSVPKTGAFSRPVKNKIGKTLRARGKGGRDAPVRDWRDTPARASGRGRGSGRGRDSGSGSGSGRNKRVWHGDNYCSNVRIHFIRIAAPAAKCAVWPFIHWDAAVTANVLG